MIGEKTRMHDEKLIFLHTVHSLNFHIYETTFTMRKLTKPTETVHICENSKEETMFT